MRWLRHRFEQDFPPFPGSAGFLTAISVDAIGTGLALPVTVLFFNRGAGLSLGSIGTALGIASIVSLALLPLWGRLVDQISAKPAIILIFAIRALGFGSYLFVRNAAELILAAGVVAACDRAWPVASQAMISGSVAADRRSVWFGGSKAIRNGGMALGGVLAGLALAVGPNGLVAACRALVIGNCASFVVSAALCGKLPAGQRRAAAQPERRSWAVLHDRKTRLFLVCVTPSCFCYVALLVLSPIWAAEAARKATWIASALLTTNALFILFCQIPISKRVRTAPDMRITAVGSGLLAVSYLIFAGAPVFHSTQPLIAVSIAAMVVFSAGIALFYPSSSSALLDMAPRHLSGQYLAAYQAVFGLAYVIGPPVLLWELQKNMALPWLMLAILSLLGAAGQARIRLAG